MSDNADLEDGADKQDYVKKEYVARPYDSNSGCIEDVESSIVKNSRALLNMRITRERKEFGQDGFNFMDKDSGEFWADCKGQVKHLTPSRHLKKVLDSGFQASSEIKRM
jgi:hypothetical protein